MIQCKINFQKTLCVLSIPLYLSSTFSVDAYRRDSFDDDSSFYPDSTVDYSAPGQEQRNYDHLFVPIQITEMKHSAELEAERRKAAERKAKRQADLDLEGQLLGNHSGMPQRSRSEDSGYLAHIKRNKKTYVSLLGASLLGGIAMVTAWWAGAFSGKEIQSGGPTRCPSFDLMYTDKCLCAGMYLEDSNCFKNPADGLVCRDHGMQQGELWIKAVLGSTTMSPKPLPSRRALYSCPKPGDNTYVSAPDGFHSTGVVGQCSDGMSGSLIYDKDCKTFYTCGKDDYAYFLKLAPGRDPHTVQEKTFLSNQCPPGMKISKNRNIVCAPPNSFIHYPLNDPNLTVRGYCDAEGSFKPCIAETPVQPPVQPDPCDSSNPTDLASGMTVDMRTQKNCNNKKNQQCWRIQGSRCEVFVEPLAGFQSRIISSTGESDRYEVICNKAMKCKPSGSSVKCTETNRSRTFEVIVKSGKRFIQSWQESSYYPFTQESLRRDFGDMHKLWYDTVDALETYQGLFFRHDVVEGVLCGRGPVKPQFTVSCASTIQQLPDFEGLLVSSVSYIQMDPRQSPRGTALHEIQHPLANSDTRFKQLLKQGNDGRTYHYGPYTMAANGGKPVKMQLRQSVHFANGFTMEQSSPSAYDHAKEHIGTFSIAGLKDLKKTVNSNVKKNPLTAYPIEDNDLKCHLDTFNSERFALFNFNKHKYTFSNTEDTIQQFFKDNLEMTVEAV